ncbi:GNAT family N-acetyltransferase [Massilia sp. CF038]|uniref:GNAT family N-acetyltransferase n=1 Tax=Massilia sp. CF038 TaxID=1881045 RepID=UPI000912C908|nr:GNAT family N-acetyltransferase [Massilia sp. CF038]SHG98895.1 Ribosomal protein S18 acetylase RimI [Massilia sp. CF038]
MQIRPLSATDIPAAASLLRLLAERSIVQDCAPVDAAAFLREHDADGIARHLADGMAYHVATRDDVLLGFIGVRERRHVFHMFVDQAHQRQGVARALWQHARAAAGNPAQMTVNAAIGAVPVYRALGFVPTAPVQSRNGIAFHPMQFEGSVHA